MSKIGKIPVSIPEGVTVSVNNDVVTVTATRGNMTFSIPKGIRVAIADGKVVVSKKKDDDTVKALFGLTRASIANMVQGVSRGFEKKLEMSGVGYRAQLAGNDLTISVGFSHPVKVKAPEGIKFSVAENVITVSGNDSAVVGNTAAVIRKIRPPEPYKGKGIKYVGERIRRKAGKAAKAVGGK